MSDNFKGLRARLSDGKADATDQAIAAAALLAFHRADEERQEREKYNGWTNRETWALKLHIDNTESSQAWLREVAALAGENAEATEYRTLEQAKLYTTEDAIKDAVETAFERALKPTEIGRGQYDITGIGESVGLYDAGDVFRMIADVGSLWRVNWREIAEHVLEEAAET